MISQVKVVCFLILGLSIFMGSMTSANAMGNTPESDTSRIPLRFASGIMEPFIDFPDGDCRGSRDYQGAISADGVYIVQFDGPVQRGWREGLERLEVEVYDYIPDYAYMIRASKNTLPKVCGLEHVRWIGVYLPEWRLAPELGAVNETDRILIDLFPFADSEQIALELRNLGATELQTDGHVIQATLPGKSLIEASRLPGIRWIERASEHRISGK